MDYYSKRDDMPSNDNVVNDAVADNVCGGEEVATQEKIGEENEKSKKDLSAMLINAVPLVFGIVSVCFYFLDFIIAFISMFRGGSMYSSATVIFDVLLFAVISSSVSVICGAINKQQSRLKNIGLIVGLIDICLIVFFLFFILAGSFIVSRIAY